MTLARDELTDNEFVNLARRFELEMVARTLALARLPVREFPREVERATDRMLRYARPALSRGALVEVNLGSGTEFLAAVQQAWAEDHPSAATIEADAGESASIGTRSSEPAPMEMTSAQTTAAARSLHDDAIDEAVARVETMNAVLTRGLPLWDARGAEAGARQPAPPMEVAPDE